MDNKQNRPTHQNPQGEMNTGNIVPEIGIWGALAIGVGTMIAAGIFVLSGLAVSNVGSVAIISFLIAAVVAGFTAFAYAEFSSIYQESGGGYMYVANTFDSNLTYIVGWSMILGYPASAAFYLASFSDWFYRFIYPVFNISEAIPYWSAGLATLFLLAAVNIKGTKETGFVQIVITSVKIVLLGLFLYGGLQAFNGEVIAQSFIDHINDFKEIGLTSALVFITFFGFEAIATNSEEIENPGKTVPRAIFISMGFVTLIYVFVVMVIVLAINDPAFLEFLRTEAALSGLTPIEFVEQNGEIAMGRAAQYYLGQIGFYVIIVGALFSMLSAANATILAGSRVKLAMARREHLPRRFENLHDKFRTPYLSVLLTAGLIFLYLLIFSVFFGDTPGAEEHGAILGIEALAHFADFMLLAGLIAVNGALIQSRHKFPDVERGFKVPFVPWIPILAMIANLTLLLNVEGTALIIGLFAEFIGVAFWFLWMKRVPSAEAVKTKAPIAVSEFTAKETKKEYRLVIPIANPDHIKPLMRTAIHLANHNNGELLLVSIITVPNQTPLSYGRSRVENRRKILKKAQQQAKEAGVPANSLIRIAHHAGEAITNTISQYNVNAVLTGWKGRPSSRRDVILGTTLDTIVAKADCDVLVEKVASTKTKPQSILLPSGGGPHARLATETAVSIARETGASLHIIRVIAPSATDENREEMMKNLQKSANEFEKVEVSVQLIEGTDIVSSIAREAENHDVVMIGATQEGLLQRFIFGELPAKISQRISKTVIMAKRKLPVHSRLIEALKKWWFWPGD